MTEKQKLGNEFKNLREGIPSSDYNKEHISQQELADKNLGLTKYLIGTVERGMANPTLEKLVYHAKALDLKTLTISNTEIDVDKFIREDIEEKKKKKKK